MNIIISNIVENVKISEGDIVVFEESGGAYLVARIGESRPKYRLINLTGRTSATGEHDTILDLDLSLRNHEVIKYSQEDYELKLVRRGHK